MPMDRDTALKKLEHYMKREGYRPKTTHHYLEAIRNNIPNKDMEKLQQEDLDEIKLNLTQTYQPRGNRIRFSGINLFCKVILQRPDLHLTLPRPKTKNKDVLTRQQVNEILEFARMDSKRTYAILLTLYDCALRKGEVINLDCSDVKYETNELCLRDAKTGDGIVTISDRALEAIKDYIAHERKPKNKEETALFLNKYGERIGEKCVRYYLKKCAAQAGIPRRVYPHIFRASCITHLLNDHVNPATVQHHARHQNFATTMLYNRPTQQQMHRDIKNSFDNQYTHPGEQANPSGNGTIRNNNSNNTPDDKHMDRSDRIMMLVDKLIAGDIGEETFKTIVTELQDSPKIKNGISIYQ
jgi:site-specific recombinase XerD